MILSCNSCEKKFVVPDNAISASGRLVQCSSCGNKWTQYPIDKKIKPIEKISKTKPQPKKIQSSTKTSKRKVRKKDGPDLYSPEYLAKKHGIKIGENKVINQAKKRNENKINFGFYNSLIVFIITIIFFVRILYFTEYFIISEFPFTEVYIEYLFESIKNLKDIFLNLIISR